MGPLPRTHGLLGATLESEDSYRTLDIKRDPRFRGWWPSAHPLMGSFLGVPIVARGEVVGAFYLTDKEAGRGVRRRGPGADRDARAARRGGDGERAPLRAQPRAVDRRGAQPAGARAARLAGAEAVRGRARGTVGRHPARARLGGRPRAGRARCRSWPRRRWWSCARWSSSCAPRSSRRRAWRPPCASTSSCCGARTGRRSALELTGAPRLRPGVDEEVFRIAQESLQNALRHCRRRAHRAAPRRGRRRAAADGRGRRRGLRAGGGGPALAPPRPDLDGGARPRAGRLGCGSTRRPAAGPRSPWRWTVTEIRVLIADDHAVVRQGLRTFLELQDDIEVVADVADGEAALSAVAGPRARRRADGPGHAGRRRRRGDPALREARPEARVLVLTSFLDDEKLFPAVRAGAAGLPAQGRRAGRAGARDPHGRRRRGAAPPGGGGAADGGVLGDRAARGRGGADRARARGARR